ncbi:hypothetical protein KBB12_01195 [Candidatus Woesebacteria bacterium]|nr:hypothetical protein [Candidatus Woesebacteria bacterium]
MSQLVNHNWSIIAGNAVVDATTNNLSIFDIIEEFTFTLPKKIAEQNARINIPAVLKVVSLWTRAQDKLNNELSVSIKTEYISPKGEVLLSNENLLTFPPMKERMRSILTVNGLQASGPGRYYVSIYKKEIGGKYELANKIPIDMKMHLIEEDSSKQKIVN